MLVKFRAGLRAPLAVAAPADGCVFLSGFQNCNVIMEPAW